MHTPVGTLATTDIDRELTPLLVDLLTLGPQSENHPVFRQLLKWLVNPQRTANDINYVIVWMVYNLCNNTYVPHIFFVYLGQVAAEALALKSPILEGPWEHTAWLVVNLLRFYDDKGGLQRPSDHLTAWIIRMIGDSNLCPNLHLRIELMFLFDMVPLDKNNSPQATEAVMSACSGLSIEYLSGVWNSGFVFKMDFYHFFRIFKKVIENGHLPMYALKLSKCLNEGNNMRLSERKHDVSYRHAFNSIKHTEPGELRSLIALINTSASYVRKALEMRSFEEKKIRFIYDIFQMLIYNFEPCYKMPQLIQPTAMLAINVLEFILKGYKLHNNSLELYVQATDRLLKKILTEDRDDSVVISPIGLELISCYGKRLRDIRVANFPFFFYKFPTIRILVTKMIKLDNIEICSL